MDEKTGTIREFDTTQMTMEKANDNKSAKWHKSLSILSILFFHIFLAHDACLKEAQKNPRASSQEIILATTTSLYDSGLLDVLCAEFSRSYTYRIKMIAVGTGEALRMGKEGNADLLIAHSPPDEEEFMTQGWGKDRRKFLRNDFILLGPPSDPARIKGLSIVEAFQAIYLKKALFLSRADNSGTHRKEEELWIKTGLNPQGSWYLESGQGMGESLMIASEKAAYVLSDRATYLALKKRLGLKILVEGQEELLNIYHVITVNPAQHPGINYQGAKSFMNFLISERIQNLIGEFGKAEFEKPVFIPEAGKT